MILLRAIVIGLFCLLPTAVFINVAHAVTPPTPTESEVKTAKFDWIMPTTRADGSALPLSEIRQANLYVESLAAPIVVPAPATSYSYALPPGACIKKTENIQATATDTNGLESAASERATLSADICGPKSRPAAPTGLTVSAGSSQPSAQ
jgi:hypothetical protein